MQFLAVNYMQIVRQTPSTPENQMPGVDRNLEELKIENSWKCKPLA